MKEHLRVPLILLTLFVIAILSLGVGLAWSSLTILGSLVVWLVLLTVVICEIAFMAWLWKWLTKPHVTHIGPYGSHIIHRGKAYHVEPLGNPTGEQVQLIQPPVQAPSLDEYWDYEDEKTVPVAETHDEEGGELGLAKRCYDAGNCSREKLAAAMTAAGPKKVSGHRAGILLTIMRERSMIDA